MNAKQAHEMARAASRDLVWNTAIVLNEGEGEYA
jgi:hypothetical protein